MVLGSETVKQGIYRIRAIDTISAPTAGILSARHTGGETLHRSGARRKSEIRPTGALAGRITLLTMRPGRVEFRIAVLRSGKKMYDVARELGVSYNHLCLVLDGERKGSQRLEEAIAPILARNDS